jgi:hypothetical protein
LTPAEFRKLTPAEFRVMANAKIEQQNREAKFQDRCNAKLCYLIARAHRMTIDGGRDPEERDFMLIKSVDSDSNIDPEATKNAWIAWANFAKVLTDGEKNA